MDQQLLPPYAATTVDLKSLTGKSSLGYPPLSAKSTSPQTHHATSGRRDDRCGNLHRTIVLCLLALALCAGFVFLYLQMRDLERQVQELRELTYRTGSYGPFDDDEMEQDLNPYHPMKHEKIMGQLSLDEEGTPKKDEDSVQHEGHVRERRSFGGSGSSRPRVHPGHRQGQYQGQRLQGEPSAHVIPRTGQPSDESIRESGSYSTSEWFIWTDQEPKVSHASIPLHSTGKFLIAPHAGYYYIYSQITLNTCNNRTDTHWRGHSLNVKTNCGRSEDYKLTYTTTTPSFRDTSCSPDSSYIGGVYYLGEFDLVGVKPYMPHGRQHARYHIRPGNSYFGMFPIRRFNDGTQRRCQFDTQQWL